MFKRKRKKMPSSIRSAAPWGPASLHLGSPKPFLPHRLPAWE